MAIQTLRKSEQVIQTLRSLYEAYGYRMFRMSKFEAYDFYTTNRDFLAEGPIITFSDTDGKLLALKPDITLSIVKDTRATFAQPEKVYYHESVYRVSRDVRAYKEIQQLGLEYIGAVTPYVNAELVLLAAKSLRVIGEGFALDVSHMGFLTGLMESFTAPRADKERIQACIGKKSVHELKGILSALDVPAAVANGLVTLTGLSGGMEDVLEQARALVVNDTMHAAYKELKLLSDTLAGSPLMKSLTLDFSIINDVKYYNGLLMRGYVDGVPRAVLSGGRYDPLLTRMGKRGLQAIGFAIGCDEVERYLKEAPARRYDTVVLYDDRSDYGVLTRLVETLADRGQRVYAAENPPEGTYETCIRVVGKETREEKKPC